MLYELSVNDNPISSAMAINISKEADIPRAIMRCKGTIADKMRSPLRYAHVFQDYCDARFVDLRVMDIVVDWCTQMSWLETPEQRIFFSLACARWWWSAETCSLFWRSWERRLHRQGLLNLAACWLKPVHFFWGRYPLQCWGCWRARPERPQGCTFHTNCYFWYY